MRSPRTASVALILALVSAGCGQPAPTGDSYVVAWGGDVLLGDAAEDALAEHGYAWPFERLADLLDADYLVVNAEGPITRIGEPYFPEQEFSYNAQPAAAQAMADVGIDAAGLSNNHALDRGPDGLRDTIANLADAGVTPFGAGTDAEASAPLLVETPSGILAIVGLGERWTYGAEAGPTEAGTVSISAESVAAAHRRADEAGARWVVAFVHWGENYAGITDGQREAAQLFADAGYDLVIGHHPHVVQEVDLIDGMPVIYSLGNLVFGTPGRFEAGQGYGLVARTELAADGGITVRLACIVTDNDAVAFQPEPCTPAEALAVLGSLGPDVRIEGDRAVVETR